jgi:hypothetical protein
MGDSMSDSAAGRAVNGSDAMFLKKHIDASGRFLLNELSFHKLDNSLVG